MLRIHIRVSTFLLIFLNYILKHRVKETIASKMYTFTELLQTK